MDRACGLWVGACLGVTGSFYDQGDWGGLAQQDCSDALWPEHGCALSGLSAICVWLTEEATDSVRLVWASARTAMRITLPATARNTINGQRFFFWEQQLMTKFPC
tara:strand:+ start:638 stop:952 length:315 start_codon:yes stop_codon:yes gene_type:complete